MTTQTVTAGTRRIPLSLAVLINAAIYLVFGGVAAYAAWSDTGAPLSAATSSTSVLELFGHNIGVLVWLATGLCSAGLLTGAVIGLNGIMLGWVVGKQIASDDLHSLLTGVLPHLPLEIAAYIISAAASMRLGVEVLAWLRHRRTGVTLRWRGWATVQATAVGLLLLGAVIEANVSHV